ncbi:MAG: hypothetical protein NTX49_02525 [Chlamydiae bacterium]|nr:hypothetical protein [Chlamydiota bacterium]
MVSPVDFSSDKDSVDYLAYGIDTYQDTFEYNSAISRLCKDLIGTIQSPSDSSKQLLAKCKVIICPRNIDKLRSAAFEKGAKARIAYEALISLLATVDESATDVIEEMTNEFLRGDLFHKSDIPLIEYLIEKSSVASPIYSDPETFIRNLSKETAKHTLITLIEHNPEFFLKNIGNFFTQLTRKVDLMPRFTLLEKADFLEVLSHAPPHIRDQIRILLPSIWEQFSAFTWAEIPSKSGPLWKCVGMKNLEGEEGGAYVFSIKNMSFSEFGDIQKGLFPALQIDSEDAALLLNEKAIEFRMLRSIAEWGEANESDKPRFEQLRSIYEKRLKALPLFKALGYEARDDNTIIILPDRELLMQRYNKLRQTDPLYKDLPVISIASDEGVASDDAFIEAHMKHDGMMSRGPEFLHDSWAHIIPLLTRASFGSKEYKRIRDENVRMYQSYLDSIDSKKEELGENYLIFKTLLGAFVDLTSAQSGEPPYTFTTILEDFRWIGYLEKNYDGSPYVDESGIPRNKPKFDLEVIKKLLPLVEDSLPPT